MEIRRAAALRVGALASSRSRLVCGVLLAGALLLVPLSARAQQSCAEWQGKVPAITRLDSLFARFATIAPKDEFESTAAYRVRLSRLVDTTSAFVLEKPIEDRKYLAYDADARELEVQSFAFNNTNIDWSGYLRDAPLEGDRYRPDQRAVVLSSKQVRTGARQARTAMGVEFTVAEVTRDYDAIFESWLRGYSDEGMLPRSKLERIPMSPDSARAFKSTARVAFVYSPRIPFAITGTRPPSTARVDLPVSNTDRFRVAVGQIQCALLMDSTGTVFRAYNAR